MPDRSPPLTIGWLVAVHLFLVVWMLTGLLADISHLVPDFWKDSSHIASPK